MERRQTGHRKQPANDRMSSSNAMCLCWRMGWSRGPVSGMMRRFSAGHSLLTATMDVSGHPRDLLEVFDRIQFELRKHAKRRKDLL